MITPALRIFVVDDDPLDLELLQIAFDQIEQRVVLQSVDTGTEGLSVLREFAAAPASTHPDLVLLDLNLPGIHGLEILAFVKAQAGLDQLRVLVLSSFISPEDAASCRRLGNTPYLVKPSGMKAYRHLVQNLAGVAVGESPAY